MFDISYCIRTMSNTWTQTDQKLLEAGYIRCADGSLIKWAPNQIPDPLLCQMMQLRLNSPVKTPITLDEVIEDNIRTWIRQNPK